MFNSFYGLRCFAKSLNPNMDFGCELSHFSDTFWNAERIRQHLDSPVDVESLVCGIKALSLFDEVI